MKQSIVCLAILTLAIISCEKETSAIDKGVARDTATLASLPLSDTSYIGDTTVFYDVEINEQRQLQIPGFNNCIFLSGGTGGFEGFSYDLSFYINSGSPAFTFKKGYINDLPRDTSDLQKNKDRLAEFATGFYPYRDTPIINNGVVIEFNDSTGKHWSTLQGSADQTNSSFQILKVFNTDPNYTVLGITHGIHVYCKFACRLYDDAGNSMDIKNGRVGWNVWL